MMQFVLIGEGGESMREIYKSPHSLLLSIALSHLQHIQPNKQQQLKINPNSSNMSDTYKPTGLFSYHISMMT